LIPDPAHQIIIGNVADEQVQRVGGLVEPAVPQVMGRQRTVRDVIGLGAGATCLVVPAAMELPIALQLGAAGLVGQSVFNVVPPNAAVLVHVARSHPVGNALVAQPCHQPVEQRGCIVVRDGRANCAVISPYLLDQICFPSKATDAMNQACRMIKG